jgi:hypothetical protein
VTSLSDSSQGEVGDNREKWGDFWQKKGGRLWFLSKKNIPITNVAEKNILILVEEKK